jgi:Domain of unknown function (DUF4129)
MNSRAPRLRSRTAPPWRTFFVLIMGVTPAASAFAAVRTWSTAIVTTHSDATRGVAEFGAGLRSLAVEPPREREQSSNTSGRDSVARIKLREILSRSEFQQSKREESWLTKLWKRFLNWLWGIISRVFGAANNKVVRNVVLYGAILVAFCALAWALVRALTAAERKEALKLAGAPLPGKTWSQWAREAIAAAGAGNYREAIHAAYWAGVYRLSELGAWQLDRARTPREYLRLLRALAETANAATNMNMPDAQNSGAILLDPAVRARRAEALAALTNRLEAVWYDNQGATHDDFRSAVQDLEILECRFPSIPQTANS